MVQAFPSAASGWLRSAPARFAARAVEIALIAGLAWIAAQAFWFAVYGTDALDLEIAAPQPARAGPAPERLDRTGPAAGLFDALPGAAPAAADAAPQTRLDMTLRGVRSGADGGGGSAVIETPNRGQRSIAVGGEIAPGVRLAAVHKDRVIIERGGARESLFLTEAAARRARQMRAPADRVSQPSPASASGTFSEPASPLSGRPDRELAATLDREDWVDGLRLEPALRDGAVMGLRVREASAIEVLRASGLLPGDVIVRLNGQALTGPDAGAAALSALSAADRVVAQVRRGDEEITLEAPLP